MYFFVIYKIYTLGNKLNTTLANARVNLTLTYILKIFHQTFFK